MESNNNPSSPNQGQSSEVRPRIEIPPRIARLPRDSRRGLPIPWFIAYREENGRVFADFRYADPAKPPEAVRRRVCWICGESLGVIVAFMGGPLLTFNNTAGEPPSHTECAQYAMEACPFLADPEFRRRTTDVPSNISQGAGVVIRENPGAKVIWITNRFAAFQSRSGILFKVGEPLRVVWSFGGRPATRLEATRSLEDSVSRVVIADFGDPPKMTAQELDGLVKMMAKAERFLPIDDAPGGSPSSSESPAT
jgi:hypothetical protein